MFRIVFFVFTLWVVSSLSSAQVKLSELSLNSKPEKRAEVEADSYFVAMLANFDSWERGDFLVKEDYVFDSVNDSEEGAVGILFRESNLTRLVFDHKKKKYSVFQIGTSESNVFNGLNDSDIEKSGSASAANFNGDTKELRFRSNHEQWMISARDEDIKGILRTGLFPDYRTACFHGFLFKTHDLSTMSARLEQKRAGHGLDEVRHRDGTVALSFRHIISNEWPTIPGPKFVYFNYDFCKDSLMPTRYEEKMVTTKFERVTREIRSAWSLIDDIYVPSRFSMSEPDSLTVNGKSHQAMGERTFVFHCFSINGDEFDDDMFDGSRMTSAKAIYQMVDPVANNATSLLPKEKK
jgi:hypothetical protein